MSRLTCLNLIQEFRNEVSRLELCGSTKSKLAKEELENLVYKYGNVLNPVLLHIACDSNRFLSVLNLGGVIYKPEKVEKPKEITNLCVLFISCLSRIGEDFSEKNIEKLNFMAEELEVFKQILKDFIGANELTFYEQNIIYCEILRIQYLLIKESYYIGEIIRSYKDIIKSKIEEVSSFLFDDINDMRAKKELKDERLLSLIEDEILRSESRNIDVMFRLYVVAIKSMKGIKENKNSISNNVFLNITNTTPVTSKSKMTYLEKVYGSENNPKVKLEYCVGNYIRGNEKIVSSNHYNSNFNGSNLKEREGYHCRLVTSFINKKMQYVIVTENLYNIYLKESLEKFEKMLFQRRNGKKAGYFDEYLNIVHNDSVIKEFYIEALGVSAFFEVYNGELKVIRPELDCVYYIDTKTFSSVESFLENSDEYLSTTRVTHSGSIYIGDTRRKGKVHSMGISGSSGEFYYTYDEDIHAGNGKEIRKKLRPDGKFDTLEGNRKNCEMINPISRVDENLEDGIPGVVCRTYLVSKNLNPEETPIVKQLK